MKPLTANLKLLYKCKELWPGHFLLLVGISLVPVAVDKFDNIEFPFMTVSLAFIFAFGANLGGMSAEMLGKPFGFCLAGQIKAVQKMFLLVWLSVTALITPLMIALSSMNVKNELVHFLGAIGIISLSYWVGVTVILPKGRFAALLFFFFIFFMIPFSIISGTDFVELIFIAHPWELFLLSSILIYLIYRAVGRIESSNRLYLRLFNREDILLNKDKRPGRTSLRVGSFFSERILSNQNTSLLAHLWGQIYFIIGPFATNWKGNFIGILFAVICFSFTYLLPGMRTFIFHLSIFILASLFCSIAYSTDSGIFNYRRYSLFLLMNRREHFWRGIVIMLTVIIIALGFISIFVLLFNLISESLPPAIWGSRYPFLPFEWALLVVPIIMIPLFGGLVILFKKIRLIISMVIIFCVAVAISYTAFIVMESTPFLIDLLIVLSAIAITWGFHIAVLYYDSMKSDLC